MPATHGQATSFFQDSGVQQEFAFIPDDGSTTYVINVETNTTQPLAGPATKDAKAQYAASITALVQLDSTGVVSFLPYKQGDASTNSNAAWSKVANIAAAAPPGASAPSGGSSAGPSGTGSGSSHPTGTGSSGSKPTSGSQSGNSTSTTGDSSDAVRISGVGMSAMMVLAGVFGVFACLL